MARTGVGRSRGRGGRSGTQSGRGRDQEGRKRTVQRAASPSNVLNLATSETKVARQMLMETPYG